MLTLRIINVLLMRKVNKEILLMPIRFDPQRTQVFVKVLPAIAEFKKAFGRDIKPDFIAELYIARELGLEIPDKQTEMGYDAIGPDGKRYQTKHRSIKTLNVDLNNFNFDVLVLVNLDDEYQLTGMWSITDTQAKSVFKKREKFRKYQATQDQVKAIAKRIR